MEKGMRYFPVGLFASVMGLCGLSIAYQRYEEVFHLRLGIGFPLLLLAYVVFIVVTGAYLLKLVKYFPDVVNEFNHPVKANFFPAFSISLLLLSIGTMDYQQTAAHYLWLVGATVHILFTIVIISRWINHKYELVQSNPAWFIPVVGNLIVPIAGVNFAHHEICWFFFSLGLFFWIILFTVIFYRIIFNEQLPQQILPTLFILIAPPAVAFISYTKLTGQIDSFARVLLYVAWFFVILLLSMARNFVKINFFVSWWAYTFPLCAVTIASTLAYKMLKVQMFGWVATGLLALTSIVVFTVLFRTLSAFKQNKVCVRDM
ncbi:SLAC1 anion channel family protein [Phosphitispora fastidiosa]|uniref:SLAC1 anion channel family protein n=1 Tax=Phosphitispora fastidiosa TaxID=2837202 RepID=UPI001E30CE7A|nr:tellurite resistance protein [Phosphitispora fastidiosa]